MSQLRGWSRSSSAHVGWFDPAALNAPPSTVRGPVQTGAHARSVAMMAAIGLEFIDQWQTADTGRGFSFNSELPSRQAVSVSGYEGMMRITLWGTTNLAAKVPWRDRMLEVRLQPDGPTLTLNDGRSEITAPIGPLLIDLRTTRLSTFPADRMSLVAESPSLRAKFYIKNLEGTSFDSHDHINRIEADVLFQCAD